MRALRVAIGVSGGVDSAVSASLLKKAGHEVVAVHMINWDPREEGTSKCDQSFDSAVARRVCQHLDIPYKTVNFVREYWNEVFRQMIDNYTIGRTVVPDIACNRFIKFQHFHDYCIKNLDADLVATGHYVSTSIESELMAGKNPSNLNADLLAGIDPIKDQSFFCVYEIAKQEGLIEVANKKESMGICFVGKRKNFTTFMDQYIEPRPGLIKTIAGKIVAEHTGIHHFTIGKRVLYQGDHLGYFVVELDPKTNTVLVCSGSHHPRLFAQEFVIRTPEWISINPLKNHLDVRFRIQRTHPVIKCRLETSLKDGKEVITVKTQIPVRAVAPGQMCVFYADRVCLGGAHTELILLVIVSSTRIQPILYEVFFCFSVFVERLVATRKLAVYEKSKYWPLSTLLILLNTLVSIICTYAIIYYLYDHYFLILFIFFPIIAFIALFSFWCLHQLYLWNHRELQTMTSFVEVKNFHEKTYANDAYLSRRFQLTENIEVLKLMHTIFKVHSVCSLVGVFLSGIPMVFLDFNTEIAQMMLVFFDLVIIV
ncbi:unnamed protein product, partial [Mesorhabditis belari]|uniref:tRNA-5-taurinomethyluridine 2-sulfurtransferase n=1 Tax=Mesorhabditis belari TaxID=2138241 RepID=A0AAF3FL61_9BILA